MACNLPSAPTGRGRQSEIPSCLFPAGLCEDGQRSFLSLKMLDEEGLWRGVFDLKE